VPTEEEEKEEEDQQIKQLFYKLSHCPYMFRHYCVILRQLVISTLPSYTSISNAAVGNIVYNLNILIYFAYVFVLLRSQF